MFPAYSDINFNGAILDGLIHRGIDLLRGQDDMRDGVADDLILDRSTELGRVLLTQDTDYFAITSLRLSRNEDFCSVIFIDQNDRAIGNCVESIIIALSCSLPHELWNMFHVLPLK